MLAYCMLPVVLAVSCLSAYISYNKTFSDKWWFTPSFMCISLAMAYVWALACKLLPNKEGIFVFSLAYDSMLIFAFYLIVPFFICHMKLSWSTIAGTILIILGFMVIKAFGES